MKELPGKRIMELLDYLLHYGSTAWKLKNKIAVFRKQGDNEEELKTAFMPFKENCAAYCDCVNEYRSIVEEHVAYEEIEDEMSAYEFDKMSFLQFQLETESWIKELEVQNAQRKLHLTEMVTQSESNDIQGKATIKVSTDNMIKAEIYSTTTEADNELDDYHEETDSCSSECKDNSSEEYQNKATQESVNRNHEDANTQQRTTDEEISVVKTGITGNVLSNVIVTETTTYAMVSGVIETDGNQDAEIVQAELCKDPKTPQMVEDVEQQIEETLQPEDFAVMKPQAYVIINKWLKSQLELPWTVKFTSKVKIKNTDSEDTADLTQQSTTSQIIMNIAQTICIVFSQM